MTVPKYEQLMLPLLRQLAAANGEANVAMLMPELAREFQ